MHAHRRRTSTSLGLIAVVCLVIGTVSTIDSIPGAGELHAQTSWRGLVVAPEQRCSPYDVDDCRYPQSVEDRIVDELGEVYGPYTGRWFASTSDTAIEHMVARSEAHDSGLCAADLATRRRFATDLLNLTLAGPQMNRYDKVDRDAAQWLPAQNRCWFAARVIAVRQRYGLTIDRREADALDQVLAGYTSKELITFARGEVPATAEASVHEEIAAWDDNRNGRARAHGIAPVTRDHPAYPFMRDGDGDGVVCESGSRRVSPASSPSSPRASGTGCGPYRNCTALRRDHPTGVPRGHCAVRINDGWTATTTAGPANGRRRSSPDTATRRTAPKSGGARFRVGLRGANVDLDTYPPVPGRHRESMVNPDVQTPPPGQGAQRQSGEGCAAAGQSRARLPRYRQPRAGRVCKGQPRPTVAGQDSWRDLLRVAAPA